MVISGAGFHLKRHENTSFHKKRLAAVKATPKVTDMLQNNNEKKHLSKKIKNAEEKLCAFLCAKNLPMNIIGDLVELNSNIYEDSIIAKSMHIKRTKATKIINTKLGPALESSIAQELKENHFSLIIDESTSVGLKKNLVVIARYWKKDQVKDIFLKLIEVQDATAEGLCQSVKGLLDFHNIPYENVIGFGADNASTMMGEARGVQARLRQFCPNLVVQSCSCHSLHLCASAAGKKIPEEMEEFTRNIYSYFSHSSKRINELKECQIFAEEKPHLMLYPSQTRWLSRQVILFLKNSVK